MEELKKKMLEMVEEGELPLSAKRLINKAKTEEELRSVLAKYEPEQKSAGRIAFDEYCDAKRHMEFWQKSIAGLGEGTGDLLMDISTPDADLDEVRASYEAHLAEAQRRMDAVYDEAEEYAKLLGKDVYMRMGFGWLEV